MAVARAETVVILQVRLLVRMEALVQNLMLHTVLVAVVAVVVRELFLVEMVLNMEADAEGSEVVGPDQVVKDLLF